MTNEEVKILCCKMRFPAGTRIRLRYMEAEDDPIPQGTEGVVDHVDDNGTVFVNWDNGRSLGLLPEVDIYEILTGEPEIKGVAK